MDPMSTALLIVALGFNLLALIGYTIRKTLISIEQTQRTLLEVSSAIVYLTADLAGYIDLDDDEDDDDDDDDSDEEGQDDDKPEPVKVLTFPGGLGRQSDDSNDDSQ